MVLDSSSRRRNALGTIATRRPLNTPLPLRVYPVFADFPVGGGASDPREGEANSPWNCCKRAQGPDRQGFAAHVAAANWAPSLPLAGEG